MGRSGSGCQLPVTRQTAVRHSPSPSGVWKLLAEQTREPLITGNSVLQQHVVAGVKEPCWGDPSPAHTDTEALLAHPKGTRCHKSIIS